MTHPVSRRTAVRAAVTLALALAPAAAPAQTPYAWNNAAGGNWNVAGNWDPAAVPADPDDAVVALAGTYTVQVTSTHSINDLTLNNPTATVWLLGGSNPFTLTGTATLTAGTLTLGGGRIVGGTITQGAGGTGRLLVQSSTLNRLENVAIGNGVVQFEPTGGRVLLAGTSAFAAGTAVTVTASSTLAFNQNTTLNNLTVNLSGSNSTFSVDASTLTLEAGFTLTSSVTGGGFTNLTTGTYVTGASEVRNQGLIRNDAGHLIAAGVFPGSPLTIRNQAGGVIRAPAGTISLGGTFTNEAGGVIDVTGGTVSLTGTWLNQGTINLSSGTLELGNTFVPSAIGTVNRTGGQIVIRGAMNNAGNTFALTPTTGTYRLFSNSTASGITGGSITATGGATLQLLASPENKLTDVAVGVGVLDFSQPSAEVRIRGTTTLAAGTALVLNGGSNRLAFEQTTTLANLTIDIGGFQSELSVEGTNTLTLGPTVTVFKTSTEAAHIRSDVFTPGTGTIVNQGTIRSGGAGGIAGIYITPDVFTNTGTLHADGGLLEIRATTFSATPVTFTNLSGGTLTGGTYRAQNGTLSFTGRTVQAVAAGTTVELNGPTATFAALDPLAANAGTLRVLGGKNFDPANTAAITNTGTIEVGAGSTLTSNLTVNGGGVLRGGGATAGTVVGNVTYDTTGGTLAPGTSPGLLAVIGNVVLNGSTTFAVELNGPAAGTGHDRLAVVGGVTLGGATLSATLGYTPAAGDRLVIIDNDGVDPVTGQFAGLTQGASFDLGGQTAYIDYAGGTGNDVVIQFTPVPEPAGVLAAAGLGLAAVGGVRRLRRAAPTMPG